MDFPFIKEAITQLFSKPSTVLYPAVDAPAKPNYRGRIVFHPENCINCNMCERVCAGQAISHVSVPIEDGEQITRSFYLGSCTFCAHCASFCTHGAIELSGDYHMVATKEEDLIVSGTYIKKKPVKKAPPAAAPKAEAPASNPAPAAREETPKTVPVVEKPAALKAEAVKDEPVAKTEPEVKASAPEEEKPAEEASAKPKRRTSQKAADAAAAAAVVTEVAAEAKAESAPAEAAPAEEAPAAPALQPRDDGKPVQDPVKCIYCTLCARNCPMGALAVDRKAKTWVLDEDSCIGCGTCAGACPKDAILI